MKTSEMLTRILAGVILVIMVLGFGFVNSQLWVLVPITIIFCISYFFDKWSLWKSTLKNSSFPQLLNKAISTFFVQLVLCAILFFIGRGLGSVLGWDASYEIRNSDIGIMAGAFVISLTLAYGAKKLGAKSEVPITPSEGTKASWYLKLNLESISIDNFYTGFLYYQKEDQRFVDENKIQETEEKLGVKLPNLLRKLYLKQNGGSCRGLWVATKANPSEDIDDWRGVFSHDYCQLNSLEKLQTVYDSLLDFLTPEEIASDSSISKETEKYIILSQRYQDTTFLDYSKSAEPRVGVVDFDGIDKNDIWFDSFDEFFKHLRRGDVDSREP